MSNIIKFHDTEITPIEHAGEKWLTIRQIAVSLGYSRPEELSSLYQSHKEEFDSSMVTMIVIKQENGKGANRMQIFNRHGAWLLGMFSRTPTAKEFRRWVLSVLEEKQAAPQTIPKHNQAIEDRRALEEHYIITGGDAMVDIQHISVRLDSLSMILEKIPEFNAAWMTLLEKLLKEARDYSLKVETSLLNIQHSKTATELQARGKRALGI